MAMDDDRCESAECVGETERSLLIIYGNKLYREVPKSLGITMIHTGEEWLAESQEMEERYQDKPATNNSRKTRRNKSTNAQYGTSQPRKSKRRHSRR
jgi:hypothetical protein